MNEISLDAAVRMNGLTKKYGDTTVVDHLDLEIPRGTFLGLIGANGAGKSTTLKMLTGLLSITEGSATVLGEDVRRPKSNLKMRVGYVPETHQIYRWMRVDQVIWFAKRFHERWNDQLCKDLLSLFELSPRKKVSSLSKGMLAKLALLLAVCHEPELLVLDEPMSGLDPIAREEFLDGVLKTVCERECTVILSSHSIEDVRRLAGRVGLLCRGRLLVHRAVDDILEQTKRIRAVLRDGEKPVQLPPSAIWQRVQQREWLVTVDDYSPLTVEKLLHDNPVDQLEVEDLSLEEIFKDYVKGQKEAA